MDLSAAVDALVPRSGGRLDRVASAAHRRIGDVAATPAGRPVTTALRGNEWLGHPMHPIVVLLPVGAWSLAGYHDLRARSAPARTADDHAAEVAIRFGMVGALVSILTGLVQYLDTKGGVRRETAVHATMNVGALALSAGSLAARRAGRRSLGRKLLAATLAGVGVSGYLGGDISYRHGVGVRPQALRSPAVPAASPDTPLDVGEVHHS